MLVLKQEPKQPKPRNRSIRLALDTIAMFRAHLRRDYPAPINNLIDSGKVIATLDEIERQLRLPARPR